LNFNFGTDCYTGSAELVASDELGSMNERVFPGVSTHGYEFPRLVSAYQV
jgi:hypothetical protein